MFSQLPFTSLALAFFFIAVYLLLITLYGLQDLSSPTMGGTWAIAVKVQSPSHQATRELPVLAF